MSEYLFEGNYSNDVAKVKVKLLLLHFEDANGINFVYSPHLDLTGYGEDFEAASESFKIVFEDFADYTTKKKTVANVLRKLGWEVKGAAKKSKRFLAPSITTVISENKYVSDIFDKYPVQTFHQDVGIPAYA